MHSNYIFPSMVHAIKADLYSNDHNLRHDQTFRFATLIKHQCNYIQCNVWADTTMHSNTRWTAVDLNTLP